MPATNSVVLILTSGVLSSAPSLLTLTIPLEVKLYNQAKIKETGKPTRKTCNNVVITESGSPKAGTAKGAKGLSNKISQHKRMAMGENVLTGKMIKKAKGGKITKTKAPKRAPATTGVRLNMGAPKSKTINARGMGAAIKGGQFRTNT